MSTSTSDDTLFGHPKGLYVLFFTELWERFSYYGMRAILVLYIMSKAGEGPLSGLGWSKAEAISLYGTYTMAVYLASIPGGLLADKLWGQRRTVLYGGLTLCAGHLVLAIEGTVPFFAGLALIVAGVGLLKPNISTMVGGLYKAGDPRRDMGFNIFYMGINIGAFASGLAVGYVGENIGWHYGFGMAGIGMLLGQAVYMWGGKYIAAVGNPPGEGSSGEAAAVQSAPLSAQEKDRVLVLAVSFFIVIVFWGAFEQAGGLMNIFTKSQVDRGVLHALIPASWFQSLNPLFIIMFATFVAAFWIWWARAGRESSSLFKMAVGTIIMGLGFVFMAVATRQAESTGSSWLIWIVLAYLFHTIGELCASPVALSFITKLAPVKYASLMMGAYFAATGLGNKVAGLIGEAAVGDAGEFAVFVGITGFCVVFGAILLVFLRPLKARAHGAEAVDEGADVETPVFAKVITVACILIVPVSPFVLPDVHVEFKDRVDAMCQALADSEDEAVKAGAEACRTSATAVKAAVGDDNERAKIASYSLDLAESVQKEAQAKKNEAAEKAGEPEPEGVPAHISTVRSLDTVAAVLPEAGTDFKKMREVTRRIIGDKLGAGTE